MRVYLQLEAKTFIDQMDHVLVGPEPPIPEPDLMVDTCLPLKFTCCSLEDPCGLLSTNV